VARSGAERARTERTACTAADGAQRTQPSTRRADHALRDCARSPARAAHWSTQRCSPPHPCAAAITSWPGCIYQPVLLTDQVPSPGFPVVNWPELLYCDGWDVPPLLRKPTHRSIPRRLNYFHTIFVAAERASWDTTSALGLASRAGTALTLESLAGSISLGLLLGPRVAGR
jgi:hypothetical protein